ncbi:LytR cell envelope-related transcriptional attenuator [Lachnospiraceae bacterium NE2001]|nr:LytR cell envelope-related transcriptional attenuator [Lachnospiraceae bacterium NE2001]
MAKRKKKQTALGLFFSFFLKAIVIILGLVILAMSAYLIKAVLSTKASESEQTAETDAFEDDQNDELLTAEATQDDAVLYEDESVAGEETAAATTELAMDASIVVLNATETAGLAAAWKDKLTEQGYTNIQTGNYTGGNLDTSKIVVLTEGISTNTIQGLVTNATFEVGSADSISCDVSSEGVQAYVIIGGSDNILAQ